MPEAVAIALLIAAYVVGGIPFGLVLARRFAKVDVRAAGSGNIGATNVARTAGKGLGILTLVLDALKGAAPVLIALWLSLGVQVTAAAGFLAIVGHVFSPYLRFKGGKGVATSLGVFATFTPLPTLIAAGAFGLVFALSRRVSAGSIVAVVALVAAVHSLDGRPEAFALAAAVAVIVLIRHRANLNRLLKGREPGV
ncbi:MAG: glycerol-3-phosphate 1-O-acyltransferase PlsY [Deltaproteobacteria bacterium]|nr:glycerol-3-phosphate 1-O-acyltransferase PlsY [Deltaproteobacteria bacterium]